jgi:cyclophilin family peptidyl-prolyl cis-trans isomerase
VQPTSGRLASLLLAAAIISCTRENASAEGGASSAPPPAPPAPVQAPDTFRVRLETSKGNVVVEVVRNLSPLGADRFYELVQSGYFAEARFFRVMPGFIAQFGMHADPAVNARWENRMIADEPVQTTNARGTIVFAKTPLPNTRSNQFFINLADNPSLDDMGFSPFGRVVEGMAAVDAIFSGYGERPDQGSISAQGNAYLNAQFPKLDFIRSATVIPR